MERFAPLLLDIWREIGRHIEIGEAAQRCAPVLARRLPVDRLLVRRLDLAHALARDRRAGRGLAIALAHRAALQELAAFCRRGRPARGSRANLVKRFPGLDPRGRRRRHPRRAARARRRADRRAAARRASAEALRARARGGRAGADRAVRGRARERPAHRRARRAPPGGGGRSPVAAHPARPAGLEREHRRLRDGTARVDGAHRAGRDVRRAGAAARRDGLRQGGRRARDPRALAARRRRRSCA